MGAVPTLAEGSTYPGLRSTYLGWEVPTLTRGAPMLDVGYLPWMGGDTYPRWGGGGVPALDGPT